MIRTNVIVNKLLVNHIKLVVFYYAEDIASLAKMAVVGTVVSSADSLRNCQGKEGVIFYNFILFSRTTE